MEGLSYKIRSENLEIMFKKWKKGKKEEKTIERREKKNKKGIRREIAKLILELTIADLATSR